MLIEFARTHTFDLQGQSSWHVRLPWCISVINSTFSKSRKHSPFFLTFFRHPSFPYTAIRDREKNYDMDSAVVKRLELAQNTLRETEELMSRQFADAKHYFKSRARSFPIGSKIFVTSSQRGKLDFKLAPKHKGPYICLEEREHTLLLKPVQGGKLIKEHKNNCSLGEWRNHWLHIHDSSQPVVLPTSSAPQEDQSVDPFQELRLEMSNDTQPHPGEPDDAEVEALASDNNDADSNGDDSPAATPETGDSSEQDEQPQDGPEHRPPPPPPTAPPGRDRPATRSRGPPLNLPDPRFSHLRPETAARRAAELERRRLLLEHGENMSRLHLEAAQEGVAIDPPGRAATRSRGRPRGRPRGRGHSSL